MTMDFTLLSIPSVPCAVETRGIAVSSAKLTNPRDKPCGIWLRVHWIHCSCESCCRNLSPFTRRKEEQRALCLVAWLQALSKPAMVLLKSQ